MTADTDDADKPDRAGGPARSGAPRRAAGRGGSYGGSKGGPTPRRDGGASRGSARSPGRSTTGRKPTRGDREPRRRDEGGGAPPGRSDGRRTNTGSKRDKGGDGGGRRFDNSGPREVPKGPAGWGRVARKGADAARRDDGRGAPQEPRDHGPPTGERSEWQRVEDERKRPSGGVRRSERIEVNVAEESLAGLTQSQRDRVRRRMGEAAAAFEAERFEQCRKILHPLVERFPSIPELRELAGLCLYRLGKWRPALRHLEAFASATGSTDQHPVMADIERALGRVSEVQRLWDELRQDDADPAVITEGRIVLAGSLADQDDLAGAIRVLEHGPVRTKRPREHHLRLWYTLADLYERAGDMGKARRGFDRIRTIDASFADVNDRLRSLG